MVFRRSEMHRCCKPGTLKNTRIGTHGVSSRRNEGFLRIHRAGDKQWKRFTIETWCFVEAKCMGAECQEHRKKTPIWNQEFSRGEITGFCGAVKKKINKLSMYGEMITQNNKLADVVHLVNRRYFLAQVFVVCSFSDVFSFSGVFCCFLVFLFLSCFSGCSGPGPRKKAPGAP